MNQQLIAKIIIGLFIFVLAPALIMDPIETDGNLLKAIAIFWGFILGLALFVGPLIWAVKVLK